MKTYHCSREQIEILLAEYATLRNEILQRLAWQIQMYTFGGTAAVAIVGLMIINSAFISGAILFAVEATLVAFGVMYNHMDMMEVVKQVRQLERRINRLVGEDLLFWERRRGLLAIGHWARLRKFFFDAN